MIKKNISRKRLINDSAWSIITAILNSIFGILTLIIIGNFWGSSGLGIFSLCLTLYMTGSIFFIIGIHNAVIYELATSGEDLERSSSFCYTALLCSIVFGVFGGIFFFVFSPWFAALFRESQMTVMIKPFAVAIPFFLLNKTAIGILNAYRRMKLIAVANIIRGLGINFYITFAGLNKVNLVDLPNGFILTEMSLALFLIIVSYKNHPFFRPSLIKAKCLVSFGWKASLSGVISGLNSRLDLLIIGLFCNASNVGIYSIAVAIAKGLSIFSGAILSVVNPLIVQLYSTSQYDKLHRTMDVLFRHGTALFLFLGSILTIYAKPLLCLLYPGRPEMLQAISPLYILLPGAIVYSGIGMISCAPTKSIGKPENALKLVSVVFCVNMVFNLLLVPFFASNGAAIATTLSIAARIIFFSLLIKKELGFSVPIIKLSLLFFIIIFYTLIFFTFETQISHFIYLLINLMIILITLVQIGFIQKSDLKLLLSIIKPDPNQNDMGK